MRVKCSECGKTHAVIPSFSLPGTSVGSEEVERYLAERETGSGRTTASKIFAGLGLSEEYPKRLEKLSRRTVDRAKALFPDRGDGYAGGYAWLCSCFAPEEERRLWCMNIECIEHGFNPVFFSRASVLLAGKRKQGIVISQSIASASREVEAVDSS